MTSTQQGWEIAARGVGFPVAAVANGVTDPPRLTQWGGETDAPNSVTLSHNKDDIQITSYPELMWGGDLVEWSNLTAFVENSYGWAWEAREFDPSDFDHLKVMETTVTPTDRGYLETRIFESPPAQEIEAQQNARSEAAGAAVHRVVALHLGESMVKAIVVGDSTMWAAGIETSWDGGPLAVLLTGGAVPVDSLELCLVDDLLAYLETTPQGSR